MKKCGCGKIVFEPQEFSSEMKEVKITQTMCRKHAAEYFGQITGSNGTS